MENRRLLVSMVLVMCVGIGAAFASGQSEESGDGVTTVTVLSSTILESPEGTVEQELADAFMDANPDIEIEFVGTPMNQAFSRITTLATADELPDIFLNTPEFHTQANDLGITADLEELFGAEFISGFYEGALEEATVDGRLQFLPWFQIPMGLFYRIDWLEEAGLAPPQNWEEFLEVAKAMTRDTNGDGDNDQWGYAMVGTNDGSGQGRFVEYLRTWGARELYETADGSFETEIDSPEAVQAYEYFAALKNEHDVVPPGVSQNSYGENISLMASETTGLMITGPHSIGAILAQNPELEGKLGSVPIPMGEQRSSSMFIFGFSVNANSDNKEAAARYIRFLMEPENQARWTEVTGRLPAVKAAGETDIVSGPAFSGFLEAVQYAHDIPAAPFYNEVRGVMGRAYQELLLDSEADAESVLDSAAEEIRRVIRDNS